MNLSCCIALACSQRLIREEDRARSVVNGLREVRFAHAVHGRDDLEHLLHVARLAALLDGEAGLEALLLAAREVRAHKVVRSVRGLDRTPGRVGLEHDAVQRDLGQDAQVVVRLERASVDADVQAHLQQLLGLLPRPRERVHDAVGEAAAVAPDRVDKVHARAAAVQEQRQARALRQLKLALEPLLLRRFAAVVQPVVVQPELAHSDDLVAVRLYQRLELGEVPVAVAAGLEHVAARRMHADRRVHVGVRLHHCDCGARLGQVPRRDDDALDAGVACALQDLVKVVGVHAPAAVHAAEHLVREVRTDVWPAAR
eukprot:Unigene10538_Nuclearia_a/m.32231 Unigene10538_Nuclearia_a/g.32231  ORF Unigene10538_Nuclearia_a/g.32231 Unigene10538_Nuclearia_a/m.32231 type:complete len:313 (-) Unigene10538_Nuclearia_a:60-998(-)